MSEVACVCVIILRALGWLLAFAALGFAMLVASSALGAGAGSGFAMAFAFCNKP